MHGRPAAFLAALVATATVLVGCSSGAAVTAQATPHAQVASDSPATSPTSTAGATPPNKARAVAETRRLRALAVLPPGAVTIPAPAASSGGPLAGPAIGTPMTDSFIDSSAFYRVPLGFDAAVAFFRDHLPAGLTAAGTQTGTSAGHRSYGWLRTEPDSGSWAAAGFALTVAEVDAHSSDVRVDGEAQWVDTTPELVSPDPTDPVLRVLPTACPATDLVGSTIASAVRNEGSDLRASLLPEEMPIGGRICSYNGLNADGTSAHALSVQRRLEPAAASTLAQRARDISLAHTHEGRHSCPLDDGRMTFVLFDYASRAPITLAIKGSGCQGIDNGYIQVGGGATASGAAEYDAFTTAVARAST